MSLAPNATIDRCWNRIGIQGDKSCPHLARHVHCRNCSVFSQAARARLDAPAEPEYLDQLTQRYAQAQAATAAGDRSLVVFRIGREWLGLNPRAVAEVIGPRPIHRIPHRAARILRGLINWRGDLTLCLDLGAILNLEEGAEPQGGANQRKCLIMTTPEGAVATEIDEVAGVSRFSAKLGLAPPATSAKAQNSFVTILFNWRDRQVSGLNESRLFAFINRHLA
jgi:chemotaxis-related protein WspD